MNASERLKNLENHVNKKEEEKRRKIEEEEREEMEMIEQIKALKPRIQDLILVGNSCVSNGIYIGKLDTQYTEYNNRYFLADKVTHHLGFDTDGHSPIYFLGIFGGGYDHYNLRTNGNIFDLDGDKLYVLRKFLNNFDEFENAFYDYVDRFH